MIRCAGLLGKCRLVIAFLRWTPVDRLTFHQSWPGSAFEMNATM